MIYTITLNPAIDRLIYLDHPLTHGLTNRIQKTEYDLGGKGFHVSHTLSKLDIDNIALGFVGSKNFEELEVILDKKKVKHVLISVENALTREALVIQEKNKSGSVMLAEKGFKVSKKHKEQLIDLIKQLITPNDWVVIAGSFPRNYHLNDFEEMIKTLKETGCFIGCDVSGDALEKAVELEVDFIKPNEHEVNDLISSQQSLNDSLMTLSSSVDYVVNSRGSEGSYLANGEKLYKVLAPAVEEVNDTGAGDCFVGSFIGALYSQKSIEHSLKLASACAASKVKHSDSSSFNLEDVNNLITQTNVEVIEGRKLHAL